MEGDVHITPRPFCFQASVSYCVKNAKVSSGTVCKGYMACLVMAKMFPHKITYRIMRDKSY